MPSRISKYMITKKKGTPITSAQGHRQSSPSGSSSFFSKFICGNDDHQPTCANPEASLCAPQRVPHFSMWSTWQPESTLATWPTSWTTLGRNLGGYWSCDVLFRTSQTISNSAISVHLGNVVPLCPHGHVNLFCPGICGN